LIISPHFAAFIFIDIFIRYAFTPADTPPFSMMLRRRRCRRHFRLFRHYAIHAAIIALFRFQRFHAADIFAIDY